MWLKTLAAVALSTALAACSADRELARGKALFDANCAICHGSDARGGGGANVAGLSKTPADLTALSLGNGGSFPASYVVDILRGYENGDHAGRRMTPFTDLSSTKTRKVRMSSGRITMATPQADLLAYLQSVQRP